MTVGSAVVDCLLAHGIDTVFGIPGTQTLPLNDAFAGRPVRYVMARHETAVTHQAWGYAEASDKMAATCVVPGPGDLNATNGLMNARNDCTPLLHLAVETEGRLRGGDAIHETPPSTYDPVCKANVHVETAASVVAELTRAIRVARTPPAGPVRAGVPRDFLASSTPQAGVAGAPPPAPDDPSGFPDASPRADACTVPADSLEAAATLLDASESPVIVAGGGVRRAGATDRLTALAERLDAPVVATYKGKGTIPEDHPRSAGVLCGASSPDLLSLLAESDACLAVGSDLDAVATRGFAVDLPDRLVHVTVEPSDLGVGYEPAVGIVADAGATLGALVERVTDRSADGRGIERARAVRAADRSRFDALLDSRDPDAPLTSVETLRAVRAALPREAVVTADAGGFRLWTLVAFPAYGPHAYVNPGSWASMGTGLPSAIGAKLADFDRPVVALTGDGGLLMCIHELHTLASESLDVTVVALNNADYAIISEEAEREFGFGPGAFGWADAPLDLCAVAAGMGVPGRRVARAEEVQSAVEAAVDADGPSLVEVVTDPAEPQASEWMRRGRA